MKLPPQVGEDAYVWGPLPECDICKYVHHRVREAKYDGATKDGPWAYMCEECFSEHGVGLGTGRGQRLHLRDPGE